MTLTDAVIGAEALIGRHLTDFEMKLVRQVVVKGLTYDQTCDAIAEILDVKMSHLMRRAVEIRIKSAGPDYDATAAVLREDTELRIKRAGLE